MKVEVKENGNEEIIEITIEKSGRVEIAAEDRRYEKKINDKYTSNYFHDEIYDGPCRVLLIRKKKNFDTINENGDLVSI